MNIGDVIRLKSGGCDMTVSQIVKSTDADGREYTTVTCIWHDDNFNLHIGEIDEECLKEGVKVS
jgi:uncharacterized protein YodC (DUF2158 family)